MPVPPEEITVANLVEPTPAKPAAPAPTPAQQKHQKLVEEYELPDSSFNPDIQAVPPVPEPVPAVARSEPAPPTKPKHSSRVLRMASDFGIPQAEIDGTEPEALETALDVMTRQMLQERQVFQKTLTERATPEQSAAPVAPAPSAATGFDLGLSKEDEEAFDPRFLSVIKKMGEEITNLKGQLSGIGQREQVRERESFQQRCDTAFSKYESILGKGSYSELNPAGPELRRRQAVLDTAARDQSKVPFERKIAAAVEALFGQQAAAVITPPAGTPESPPAPPARDQKTGRYTTEQWNASATARPSHRETPGLPPGKERATAALADEMKKRDFFAAEGANGAPVVADIDTLPD